MNFNLFIISNIPSSNQDCPILIEQSPKHGCMTLTSTTNHDLRVHIL